MIELGLDKFRRKTKGESGSLKACLVSQVSSSRYRVVVPRRNGRSQELCGTHDVANDDANNNMVDEEDSSFC
jgi:hypothetical protein